MDEMYFPTTDAERKAFDHAIDRVLVHLDKEIGIYHKFINESNNPEERRIWRHCTVALVDFKQLLIELFMTECEIGE